MHEPLDIEYSILKQRLARRLQYEGESDDAVGGLDLVGITKVGREGVSWPEGRWAGDARAPAGRHAASINAHPPTLSPQTKHTLTHSNFNSHAPALQLADRTIADDLEYLIRHTVDPRKADYAGKGMLFAAVPGNPVPAPKGDPAGCGMQLVATCGGWHGGAGW